MGSPTALQQYATALHKAQVILTYLLTRFDMAVHCPAQGWD
jgi:hypothetical protein